jgi:hypothetical protein
MHWYIGKRAKTNTAIWKTDFTVAAKPIKNVYRPWLAKKVSWPLSITLNVNKYSTAFLQSCSFSDKFSNVIGDFAPS